MRIIDSHNRTIGRCRRWAKRVWGQIVSGLQFFQETWLFINVRRRFTEAGCNLIRKTGKQLIKVSGTQKFWIVGKYPSTISCIINSLDRHESAKPKYCRAMVRPGPVATLTEVARKSQKFRVQGNRCCSACANSGQIPIFQYR